MKRYEGFYREEQGKKRIAAYCRVSTDHEDQTNSFESQQRYFRQYIAANPHWELYEVFADEGISGTSTKKRKEFNRMIDCAKNGEIDMIVTKEISRFARNTLDSIYYTRILKKLGIGVIFMNDNINTLDGDAELRLAILSSIAQEESRKTSERVKWGQKRRMEQGIVFGRSMLGYDVQAGKMTVNAEGAAVVRLIFHKFVTEGKGTHVIARELREEGVKPLRVKEWSNTVILRVLRNEKYCGDLVQKKTYTPDFLSHEKKYNRGQEELVILTDHHEPIISRELFEEANRILDRRALSQESLAKHSNRYVFSGKIKCGRCGQSYVARYKTRKDGSKYKAWACYQAQKKGKPHVDPVGNAVGCPFESIRNEDAIHIMALVTRSLKLHKTTIVEDLISALRSLIPHKASDHTAAQLRERKTALESKKQRLLELYLSGDMDKGEYLSLRQSYDDEIRTLTQIIEREMQTLLSEEESPPISSVEAAIRELIGGVEEEDVLYRELLRKMVIHDREHIDVYLNLHPGKWSFTVGREREQTRGAKLPLPRHL